MADQPSGIEEMRRRMERASRRPPPPRRAASAAPVPIEEAAAAEPVAAPAVDPSAGERAPATAPARPRAARAATGRTRRRSAGEGGGAAEPERLAADLPPVNLAIRVRRPLDERLVELIHQLRREGVRTSKVELIEMLLWELPEGAPALTERLARFRRFAPRGPGAPLS